MLARPAAVRDIHTFDAFVGCGEKRFMLPSERVVAVGYPHRDFPDMFQISGQLGMGVCDAPRVDMCSPRAQGRMAGNAMALP